MAIVTKLIGVFPFDATATARLEVDYDDTDLRVRTVRIVNPAAWALEVVVYRGDGSRNYTVLGVAGQTTEQAIATNVAARLQFRFDQRGRLDDVGFSTRWIPPA